MKKPELLSPAGDLEALKFAVLYGADAVYCSAVFDGTNAAYSMRYGNSLCESDLRAGAAFARERGVRVYLACNVVPTTAEADLFPEYLKRASDCGVDGIIAADMGIIAACRKHAPHIPVHASTQVGVTNAAAVAALSDIGVSRAVLARELSLAEISEIKRRCPNVEIEIFVHGAMCMSFSGRCLLSAYMATGANGARNANRGECAQPCRWRYYLVEEHRRGEFLEIVETEESEAAKFDKSYILNAKDLCLMPHLREVIKTGADCLKIEGRAKSGYYTAVVTAAYRAAIDAVCAGESYSGDVPRHALDEVNFVSHREYSGGFAVGDIPEQIYGTSGYVRERDFVGVVLPQDFSGESDGSVLLRQRNYFKASDELEIMSPKIPARAVKILRMTDAENSEASDVTIANKANQHLRVWFDADDPDCIPENSILRKVTA